MEGGNSQHIMTEGVLQPPPHTAKLELKA